MKYRPILFNAPMVRALLDGSKTQTRRVVKPQPKNDRVGMVNAAYCGFPHTWLVDGAVSEYTCSEDGKEKAPVWVCPHGQPGDRLWVRETWMYGQGSTPIYRADTLEAPEGQVWRPSIFMPRWASRITLEIVSVRVERLQDISEADAIAEGCTKNHNDYYWGGPHAVSGLKQMATAVSAYRDLWESLSGAGSWDLNPWVWVIEFKRVEGGAP